MINRVILVGNLTRDSESTIGPATQSTRMRIATNSVWRDVDGNRQEHAEFHTVVAFGRLAGVCANLCFKGRRVYIEGRLRTRDYEGGDGVRRHTTEIVAETMRLLDRPPSADGAATEAALESGAEKPLEAAEPHPARRAGRRDTVTVES